MSYDLPTRDDIAELLAFRPRFDAPGFVPVRRWGGGKSTTDGSFTMPWPEYETAVSEFVKAASKLCWKDHEYVSKPVQDWLQEPAGIEAALLDQLRSLLTYFVRGERFCDGHRAAMISEGYVTRILQRLEVLTGGGQP